jgi:hypothetical protein
VSEGLEHHVAELVDQSLLLHLLVLGHFLDGEEDILLAVPLSVLICRVMVKGYMRSRRSE